MTATEGASRDTRLIFAAGALGSTSVFAVYTVAPLVAAELTGSRAWSGIPGAVGVAGTAVSAATLSALMARRGRAAGLRLGYLLGAIGAVGGVASARAGSLVGLLASMLLVGAGYAAYQLGRFAAADLYPPAERPAVVGWIVWAATLGAVLGPNVLPVFRGSARRVGAPIDAAGFVAGAVFFAAALVAVLSVRRRARPETTGEPIERLRALIALPHVRAALIAMVAAQTTMVMVMTITPLHVRGAGHGLGVVGLVMSSHFAGMFAFAPIVGRLTARATPPPVMTAGLVVLVVAALGAGSTDGAHSARVALWLTLLGVGWSLTFVAGSAALTQGLDFRARVKVQGGVDAIAWTTSAVASALSGLVLDRFGYDALSYAGAVIVGSAIAAALRGRRRAAVLPTRP